MNTASAILRIICGAVVVMLCIIQHGNMVEAIADEKGVQLFGYQSALNEMQMNVAFVVVGLVGAFLALTGMVKFLKR